MSIIKTVAVVIYCLLTITNAFAKTVTDSSDVIGQWRVVNIQTKSNIKWTRRGKVMQYNAFQAPLLFLELKSNGDAFYSLCIRHFLKWKIEPDSTITLYSDSCVTFPEERLKYQYCEYANIKMITLNEKFYLRIKDEAQGRKFEIEKILTFNDLFISNNDYLFQPDTIVNYVNSLRQSVHSIYSGFQFDLFGNYTTIHPRKYLRFISNTEIEWPLKGHDKDTLKIEWVISKHENMSISSIFKISNQPEKYYQIKTLDTIDDFIYINIYEYYWNSHKNLMCIDYQRYILNYGITK